MPESDRQLMATTAAQVQEILDHSAELAPLRERGYFPLLHYRGPELWLEAKGRALARIRRADWFQPGVAGEGKAAELAAELVAEVLRHGIPR